MNARYLILLALTLSFLTPEVSAQSQHEAGVNFQTMGGFYGVMVNPGFIYKYGHDQGAWRVKVDDVRYSHQSNDDRTYTYMNGQMLVGYEFRHMVKPDVVQFIHGPLIGAGLMRSHANASSSSHWYYAGYTAGVRVKYASHWYITLETEVNVTHSYYQYDSETNQSTSINLFNTPVELGLTLLLD